ncbi:MAG: hypothetical protein Q4F09_05015 [Erysipelotrichaceae bacterium]|nr:hypothetical protein [Erysipelotrichaceae bacterium]
MGLIEIASGKSVWRGMDYYESHKVISWNKSGDSAYEGVVSGSHGENYNVYVDKLHPKKSVCNCAFAAGRRVVCKHMIALYFTAEPEAAESFKRAVEEWELEEEKRIEQHYKDLRKYVNSLSKAELRERLYDALVELEERRNRYW